MKKDFGDPLPTGAAAAVEASSYEELPTWDDRSAFAPSEGIVFNSVKFVKVIAGGSFQVDFELRPKDSLECLYWYSSNPYVADVSSDGEITAIKKGEAVIIAETYDRSHRKSIIVSVFDAPERIIDVPYISQNAKYPNGCESCSAVMALNYLGIDITVDEFIEKYLDMSEVPHYDKNGDYVGRSPWQYFLGDPRDSTGLCCYAPTIVNAFKKFVDEEKYTVEEHRGRTLDELCARYINNGVPVIFWGTMYMQTPYEMNWTWKVIGGREGETFTWVAPMHCLLLTGYDERYYYFNDPVAGKGVAYERGAVQRAYEGLYMQAVTVSKND